MAKNYFFHLHPFVHKNSLLSMFIGMKTLLFGKFRVNTILFSASKGFVWQKIEALLSLYFL